MRANDKGQERRTAPRIASVNLVNYYAFEKENVYRVLGAAQTVDISSTGIRLLAPEPLPVGATLTFNLKLGDKIHLVEGQIIRVNMKAERVYEAGVKFVDPDHRFREAVKRYLSTPPPKGAKNR
jgi:hypothetical protein